jgi:hypothetical protein
MSLGPTSNKVQYDMSSGAPASVPIPFRYWDTSDILAVLSLASGDQELQEGVDYSISSPGVSGTLTRLSTWPDAIRLTVYRELEFEQGTDLVNGAIQNAETYENALDRQAALAQQLAEILGRIVRFPITDTTQSPDLPSSGSRAGKLLGFDNLTGDPIPVAASVGPAVVTPYILTLLDDLSETEAQATLNLYGIKQMVKQAIEGAGLVYSDATLTLFIDALRKGADSTFDADKLDGQHGAFYTNAGNMDAGTLPPQRHDETYIIGLIKNIAFPIGSYYVQYPDAASNDDATEFPTAQRPATLFGGTWAEQWSTESVSFRTRGSLSDDGRLNGKQEDQFQGHLFIQAYGAPGSYERYGIVSGLLSARYDVYTGVTSEVTTGAKTSAPYTNGSDGTPRYGSETRTVNRRIKVWKRTA